jgi:hypothetical protein
MRLNIKAFAVSALIIGTVPTAILFIWCGINGFGADLVRIFESIHPSGAYSILGNIDKPFSGLIPGILINTFYAAVDSFIAGFAFASLYNLLNGRSEK